MSDRILAQASKILDFCNESCQGTDTKIHETISALEIVKGLLFRKWDERSKEIFNDQLNRLASGD